MKVFGIEWDANNQAHFGEHRRCRAPEVDDVLLSRCYRSWAVDEGKVRGEVRKRVLGQTCNERFLVVIVAMRSSGILRPITCWPLSGLNLERYLSWRRTVKR